jgi:hypothetical protein
VRILRLVTLASVLIASFVFGTRSSAAQAVQAGAAGAIEFTAYVRPSEGQAEPVRGMAFYLLSRSLSDIRKEMENTEGVVDLDQFVSQLDVSMGLKEWMKKHHRIDLAGSDFIKELTADDIIDVPEFLSAYTEQNGAALHAVIPEPKYKKDEEQKNPEKYKLHKEQYRQALRRYIQANLDSLQGLDAELRDLNPHSHWMHLQSEQQRRVQQRVVQFARTHYLVATTTTNLSGRAAFNNLTPGQYWISNLDTPALAGELRLHWDVGIAVPPAKTASIELSDLNALETSEQATH